MTNFTTTVHYQVKHTPAGSLVWLSTDKGQTWADFYGHLNPPRLSRVTNQVARRGGIPMAQRMVPADARYL